MGEDSTISLLRETWTRSGDGEAGYNLAEALERHGALGDARIIYEQLCDAGFTSGYYGLAWLERTQGNIDAADALMSHTLNLLWDDDEDGDLCAGILGVWRWQFQGRVDAEALLRRGANSFPEARASLGLLLKARGRLREAEIVLRHGVALDELWCFLPLANMCEASGRVDEAELLYERGYLNGDAHIAFNLSIILRSQGRDAEASHWLELAALGGDDLAISRLMSGMSRD